MELFQGAELTEDSRLTLGEWLDRWMEDYAPPLRPSTLRSRAVYPVPSSPTWRQDGLPHHPHGHPETVHKTETRGPCPRPSGVRTRAVGLHGAPHPRHAPPLSADAETAHVILRNPAAGAIGAKAASKSRQILDTGTDGRLPGDGGAERSVARLLLYGAHHRPAPGRDLRPHGRTSTSGPGH